jgi:hypothetical protein
MIALVRCANFPLKADAGERPERVEPGRAIGVGWSVCCIGVEPMGPEALVLFVWLFGIVAAGWLVWRSFHAKSRPFALPTLLASLVSAYALANPLLKPVPGYFWNAYIACFSLGAIFFGLHAHAMRWLLRRRDDHPIRPD